MSDAAELLRDFVNTYDVEDDADELTSPAALAAWLRGRALISGDDLADDDRAAGDRACDDDLAAAVALREGLRAALRHNHDRAASIETPAGPPPELAERLAALPLRVTLAGGAPALEPIEGGVRGGLARLAAAIVEAHATGMWPRLKVCVEHSCEWAFIDSSKNRSRSWCSMKVCGNRTKTRAYRARRKDPGPDTGGDTVGDANLAARR